MLPPKQMAIINAHAASMGGVAVQLPGQPNVRNFDPVIAPLYHNVAYDTILHDPYYRDKRAEQAQILDQLQTYKDYDPKPIDTARSLLPFGSEPAAKGFLTAGTKMLMNDRSGIDEWDAANDQFEADGLADPKQRFTETAMVLLPWALHGVSVLGRSASGFDAVGDIKGAQTARAAQRAVADHIKTVAQSSPEAAHIVRDMIEKEQNGTQEQPNVGYPPVTGPGLVPLKDWFGGSFPGENGQEFGVDNDPKTSYNEGKTHGNSPTGRYKDEEQGSGSGGHQLRPLRFDENPGDAKHSTNSGTTGSGGASGSHGRGESGNLQEPGELGGDRQGTLKFYVVKDGDTEPDYHDVPLTLTHDDYVRGLNHVGSVHVLDVRGHGLNAFDVLRGNIKPPYSSVPDTPYKATAGQEDLTRASGGIMRAQVLPDGIAASIDLDHPPSYEQMSALRALFRHTGGDRSDFDLSKGGKIVAHAYNFSQADNLIWKHR